MNSEQKASLRSTITRTFASPKPENPVLLHDSDPSSGTHDRTIAFRSLAPVHRSLPPSFAGLVALARRSDPIPSRTRPSNALAPMVLCLKTRESRSSPGPQSTESHTKASSSIQDPDKAGPENRTTDPNSAPSSLSPARPVPVRQNCRGVEQPGSSSGS